MEVHPHQHLLRNWASSPYQVLPLMLLADIRVRSEAEDQAALALLVNSVYCTLQDLSAVHRSNLVRCTLFGQATANVASDLPVDTHVRIYQYDAAFICVGVISIAKST